MKTYLIESTRAEGWFLLPSKSKAQVFWGFTIKPSKAKKFPSKKSAKKFIKDNHLIERFFKVTEMENE